jgi:aminodeoxyfutalosine deaminase
MILRARTVVTMDGLPIDDGAVAICGDCIGDVGRFRDVRAHNTGEITDLGERALLPGLINAHCHLDYTCLRGRISRQKTFTDWIRAINAEKAKLSPDNYVASINEGFAEAKRFGTTTVANLTAFPELIPHIHPPLRTCWFPELIDVRAPERASELIDGAIKSVAGAGPQHACCGEDAPWGLAPHALFTASRQMYQHCEEIAQRDHVLLTTHLAESREEMEMFRDGSGPLYDFMKSIGRPMDDCGRKTPLELFIGVHGGRALSPWTVVHLNELAESDFGLLEKAKTRLHVVHCPRSHDYFAHSPFAFKRLRALGLNICLGTDSLASNENLSLFDEMRAFRKEFPAIPSEDILCMVTVNGASALRQQNLLGRIRAGFRADLVSMPFTGGGDVFDEIIAFEGPVHWMLLNGREQRNSSKTASVTT